MQCVACGMEMQFVRAVPYQSMVSAGELHMFKCPSCQRTEQRRANNIELLPSERMQLPSVSSPALTPATTARHTWMRMGPKCRDGLTSASAFLTYGKHKVSVAARNVWVRVATMVRGKILSGLLCSGQHKVSVAVRSIWARTVAIFRVSQEKLGYPSNEDLEAGRKK